MHIAKSMLQWSMKGLNTDNSPLALMTPQSRHLLYTCMDEVVAAATIRLNVSAYFLIPQCPIEYEWSPRADMPGCIEKVSSLITHFISTHNIDTTRIYVCGTSMGAVGCWEIIKSNQWLFAAALIASGVSPRTQPDSFLNIPIYATCGSEERSYEILPWLTSEINRGGGNAKLDILQGLRHRDACDSAFTPKRIQWLFSQELKQ